MEAKLEKYLAEFQSEVYAVAISPQGRERVAVGLEDGTIEIWNLLTGTKLLSCQGHKDIIWSVAFNHDGTQVVSGGSDKTVRLWDAHTGQAIGQPFSGHGIVVWSVAFNHDGTRVVSSGSDGTVRLWDAHTGQAIGQLLFGHTNSARSVAFNHDGTQVVGGSSDKTVRLWDACTGQTIGEPLFGHTNVVRSVAFNHDGTQVVSSSFDKTVQLWDAHRGQAIGEPFSGHTDTVLSVAFNHDGTKILSSSDDKTVRLWDISDHQRQMQIIIGEHENPVHSVAFDPQENDIIISASIDGIKVWRWQGLNIRRISQAFSNDQATGEDSLDVTKELESLADVLMLRSLEPPLAVAILGGWGSGKSFGMHLIEKRITEIRCQQLDKSKTWGEQGEEKDVSPYVGHVYQIKFNAWSYAKSDLWASLMQTIFEQLDRQLTLEQQLREVGKVDDLAGSNIWRILNQMNDSDRNVILESELGEKLFAEFKDENADTNALWAILSKVRKEEQEKLKNSEIELQQLEVKLRNKNQKIERQINKKYQQINIVISVLFQFKKLSKNESVREHLLKLYGFKNKEELEEKIPIFKKLDTLNKYQIMEFGDLIDNQQISTIIQKSRKINSFLSEQKIIIFRLYGFCKNKENQDDLCNFLLKMSVLVIASMLIFYLLPLIKSTFYLLMAQGSGIISIIYLAISPFKDLIKFVRDFYKNFQETRKDTEQVKQKLAAKKDQEIKDKTSKNQQEVEKLKAQIERQKQRIGLTAQYKSLLDFVNNRLEDNSYQKLLGLMHQIQDDLADLSDHLTYKPGKTNPEKLDILKKHFPRGPARIVLYIDDLDRCPPDKVVEVLEAVKLLLNTDIFIIVLAIDDRYIGRALEQVYRGVLKRGGTPSGVDYLEKIVQIPYRMRPINTEVTDRYLTSLVDIDIEEKAKPETSKNPEIPKTLDRDNDVKLPNQIQKRSEEDIENSSPPQQNQDPENVDKQKNKPDNRQENTDSSITVQKFTLEEFAWIKECCQHVDLTPRTVKRLINICKIIKTIWTPTKNDKTWEVEPSAECKQTLIAFLALAGRYPKEMRKVLEEIYLEFETEGKDKVTIPKDKWLNHLQNLDAFMDRHNQREWKKFKTDFRKMPPEKEFVFEKRTFNLAVSFCFVGDIGYDPDDNYNREYRFEDRQKQYGFPNV
jgi:WD40 repeat protein/predicted KAP-like P-loop ATPase